MENIQIRQSYITFGTSGTVIRIEHTNPIQNLRRGCISHWANNLDSGLNATFSPGNYKYIVG